MEEEKKIKKNTIKKNKEGYGYKYTELAEINKYCMDNNITYYQEIETNELNLKDYIITYVTENEQTTKHKGCQIVDAVLSGIKNPVQEYGSSLTYCRRYSLLLALGLATEDNDAQDLTMPEINSVEEAKAYKLTWGKYAGKTLGEIDENYLQWLMGNTKDESIKTACDFIINHTTQKDVEEEVNRNTLLMEFQNLIDKSNTDLDKLLFHYEVDEEDKLTNEQIKDAILIMKEKIKNE